MEGVDDDSARFTVLRDDSSGIVAEKRVECTERGRGAGAGAGPEVPTSVEHAVRVAIKLAVDAGDYGLAATLFELAKRSGTGSGGDGAGGGARTAERMPTAAPRDRFISEGPDGQARQAARYLKDP